MKIYLSSTYEDLRDHRLRVLQSLQAMKHDILDAMEISRSRGAQPSDEVRRDVKGSDAYVLLLAHRYGFQPPGSEQSITEIEFRTAVDANLPIFVFTHDETEPWPPQFVDKGASAEKLERLRTAAQQWWKANFTSPEDLADKVVTSIVGFEARRVAAAAPVAPTSPQRPTLPPPPEFGYDDPVRNVFIGRQVQLGRVWDAVEGMLGRAAGEPPLYAAGNLQLLWFHGFGGMGKSWFLRRVYTDILGDGRAAAALVDWDSEAWRAPLSGRPVHVRELFKAIAWRLGQTYGAEALDTYWAAERMVEETKRDHIVLRADFDAAVMALIRETRAATPTGDYLPVSEPGIRMQVTVLREILENGAIPLTTLEQLRSDRPRYESLFETWAQEFSPSANDVTVRPHRALCDTLAAALMTASATRPLVLVLDTCEVLPPALDYWLRQLLIRPLVSGAHVLVLIGSQLRPDVGVRRGSREGWLQELPRSRFEAVAFDEDLEFTVDEMEEALGRLRRPAPPVPNLPEHLIRITKGVPYAIRVLLDLHEEAGDEDVLGDAIRSNDIQELNPARAAQEVRERVTDRFFAHLTATSAAKEDFRDVMALAILPRADSDVLKAFWNVENAYDRLRQLAQRYSIVATGDLHPTVRELARRRWRYDPPAGLSEVVASLAAATDRIRPAAELGNAAQCAWNILRLSVLAWANRARAIRELLRALVVALAFKRDTDELTDTLIEIEAKTDAEADIRRHVMDWRTRVPWDDAQSGFFRWLRSMKGGDWSEMESASADLILGLALANESGETPAADTQRGQEAPQLLGRAAEAFGDVSHMKRSSHIHTSAPHSAFRWTVRTPIFFSGRMRGRVRAAMTKKDSAATLGTCCTTLAAMKRRPTHTRWRCRKILKTQWRAFFSRTCTTPTLAIEEKRPMR